MTRRRALHLMLMSRPILALTVIAQDEDTVSLTKRPKPGQILTDVEGMTLCHIQRSHC